jgi:hypothetical protein
VARGWLALRPAKVFTEDGREVRWRDGFANVPQGIWI